MFECVLWIVVFVPVVNAFLAVLAFMNPGVKRPGLYFSHHVTGLLACLGITYLVLFGLLHVAGIVPYPLAGNIAVDTGLCAVSAAISWFALPELRG
jgi:hypothetical protein